MRRVLVNEDERLALFDEDVRVHRLADQAGGRLGWGAALSSGEGVSASGSMAVCTICAAGIAGSGAAGVAGMGHAGAENTGGGVTRGAAKADAVGERSAAVSSAGAAGA